MPSRNNAPERTIGRIKMKVRTMRGQKSWPGMQHGPLITGTTGDQELNSLLLLPFVHIFQISPTGYVTGAIREEVERLVAEYNQRGEHREVYALDGKAVCGMRKKDEEGNEYLLSVYNVEQAKVRSQVEVGHKENEITKAPRALKLVEISQKAVTGDALHTQRDLATQILDTQGEYVLPVKENQPQLYNHPIAVCT